MFDYFLFTFLLLIVNCVAIYFLIDMLIYKYYNVIEFYIMFISLVGLIDLVLLFVFIKHKLQRNKINAMSYEINTEIVQVTV